MNRNRLLVVALAASIVLLVPSSAVPFDPFGTDTPDATDAIEMAPTEGPNSEYAILNEDDEIELLIGDANPYVDANGVPQQTAGTIPRIFTVTNTGRSPAEVWITDDAAAIEYVCGDGSDSIEGEAHSVVLASEETVAVGVRIDADDGERVESADSFTVRAVDLGDESSEADDTEDPTPTDTPSPTETVTPTPSPTATQSPTVTATPTDTATPAETTAATTTPTSTKTDTPTDRPETVSQAGLPVAATDTPTATPPSPESTDQAPAEDDQTVEEGGLNPSALALVAGGLAALTLSLGAFRWYR